MQTWLRPLRGVLHVGLMWAPAWMILFFVLLGGLMAVLNPGGGMDVGPFQVAATMAGVGFVSGTAFGLLLSFAERGKAVHALSPGRAALWGALAAAAFPLLTGRADQVFWTCPLGALLAVVTVVLARKSGQAPLLHPQDFRNRFSAHILASIRDILHSPIEPSA